MAPSLLKRARPILKYKYISTILPSGGSKGTTLYMCPSGVSVVNGWACKMGTTKEKKKCKKEVDKFVADVQANRPIHPPCWVRDRQTIVSRPYFVK